MVGAKEMKVQTAMLFVLLFSTFSYFCFTVFNFFIKFLFIFLFIAVNILHWNMLFMISEKMCICLSAFHQEDNQSGIFVCKVI